MSRPIYEHPWAVRFSHWVNAVTVIVLTMSGLQIFSAFPSFGSKLPQENLIEAVPKAITLGGWLGGALQWHFTFMWIFAGAGLMYVVSQVVSGHYRTVLFSPRDVRGVWPIAHHYFLFGPKPPAAGQYNPLQKLAYTSTLFFGAVSLLTGLVMYNPVQFSALGWLFGGYHGARLIHFVAMCGLLAFIPGHLVMVALHGWDNFASMVTGWKRRPDASHRRAADDSADLDPQRHRGDRFGGRVDRCRAARSYPAAAVSPQRASESDPAWTGGRDGVGQDIPSGRLYLHPRTRGAGIGGAGGRGRLYAVCAMPAPLTKG